MTETKFTRGPWEAINRDTCQFIYAKGYERAICQVDSYSKGFGPDRDERDANAHLIAAAPKLYAALETAIEEINHLRKFAGDNGAMIDDTDFVEGITALAKARGEA